jgi:hypothetical protein
MADNDQDEASTILELDEVIADDPSLLNGQALSDDVERENEILLATMDEDLADATDPSQLDEGNTKGVYACKVTRASSS